jgi:hypothetical protein
LEPHNFFLPAYSRLSDRLLVSNVIQQVTVTADILIGIGDTTAFTLGVFLGASYIFNVLCALCYIVDLTVQWRWSLPGEGALAAAAAAALASGSL